MRGGPAACLVLLASAIIAMWAVFFYLLGTVQKSATYDPYWTLFVPYFLGAIAATYVFLLVTFLVCAPDTTNAGQAFEKRASHSRGALEL